MKPLSLDEIEGIRMYGMSEPTDFARFAHTARLAHEMKEFLYRINNLGHEETDYGMVGAKAGDISGDALELWEQE